MTTIPHSTAPRHDVHNALAHRHCHHRRLHSFGWDKLSDADKLKKRSVELNNGKVYVSWTGAPINQPFPSPTITYHRRPPSPAITHRHPALPPFSGRAAQMGILALMVHEQLGVSIWPGGI